MVNTFLKSSKENDDLEEALSEEWVNFANLTKIRFEDHPDMRVSVFVGISLRYLSHCLARVSEFFYFFTTTCFLTFCPLCKLEYLEQVHLEDLGKLFDELGW